MFVHPSFAYIINQMTPLDAKIFSKLNNPFYLAICNSYTGESSKHLQDIFLDDEFTEIRKDVSLSINNLERLGLIYVKFNMITTFAPSMHQETINRLKKTRYYKECIQTYGENNVDYSSYFCFWWFGLSHFWKFRFHYFSTNSSRLNDRCFYWFKIYTSSTKTNLKICHCRYANNWGLNSFIIPLNYIIMIPFKIKIIDLEFTSNAIIFLSIKLNKDVII